MDGAEGSARRKPGLLLAILLTSVALRVWGLGWGLPERLDFNPDERLVLRTAARLTWQDWDPHFYSYSGLTFELFALLRGLARLVHPGISEASLVLLCRGLDALLGAGTVALLFVLLRRLAPEGPAAPIGAAFLALMPLHVWDSHMATTDVGLAFWALAAVTAAVRAYETPTPRAFAVASALVGVAVGVKFNGALAATAVATAGLLAVREGRLSASGLVGRGALGVGAALGAVLVTSPFSVLRWRKALAAFEQEYAHVHSLDYGFNLGAPGWQYHPYVYELAAAFPFSFGALLYAAVLAGVVYVAVRPRRVYLVPLSYAAVYFVVAGSWTFVPLRYYLPIEPILLVPPALMCAAGMRAGPRLRWTSRAALALVVAYTAAFTVSTTARFAHDTRTRAAPWLQRRVAEGRSVLLVGVEWYLPHVVPGPGGVIYLPGYGQMLDVVAKRRPDYVVLTSLLYARAYRQHDENVALWDTVRQGRLPYELVRRFASPYLNSPVYSRLDPMYEGYFVSPTIEVYARRDGR